MRRWLPVVCAALLSLARQSSAQAPRGSESTRAGVYSASQALRGSDVYAGSCKSCHTPESHAGPAFYARWNGRPLLELYEFIRDRMPKNEPGSLSAQEYADVLAYLLKMNQMPSGRRELPADSLAMKAIRIETMKLSVRKDP
jgi:mono/diheme cytochrome c family protein